MLISKKTKPIAFSPKAHVKEPFDMKVVTYLTGSPDEIANCLMNEKQRSLWDPALKMMTKIGDDKYKIIY